MIVGAYIEHAAPEHAAGAEWTIQDAFSWLAGRGHDCRVMARKGSRRAMVNGVRVYSQPSEGEAAQHFMECDVMLTQLDATADAQLLAASYQTPLVQLVHSASQLEELGVVESCRALVVYNAEHVAAACGWWEGASMTLHPPVDEARVRCEPGQCATLVNVSHLKGGMALHRLAERLETVPFMGVRGAYGEQMMGPEGMPGAGSAPTPTGLPANLRVFNQTEDIARDALSFTRVLLVLSMSETYGRVAAEAMVSGIPVIAARTPGLYEACGDAARYVEHRDDDLATARLVERAMTPEWLEWSADAKRRAGTNAQRQGSELRVLESNLKRIAQQQPVMTL